MCMHVCVCVHVRVYTCVHVHVSIYFEYVRAWMGVQCGVGIRHAMLRALTNVTLTLYLKVVDLETQHHTY